MVRQTSRVVGYHYVVGRNGRKHRVYGRGGKSKMMKGTARRGSRAYSRSTQWDGDVIMGSGAYYTRQGRPSSKRSPFTRGRKMTMGLQAPRVYSGVGGQFTLSHEEYLGDLNSSQAFVNTAFVLNPGLSLAEGGFTNWLPNVAQQFEQYKLISCVFTFKSTSSDAVLSTAANSALGTVSMATDYNVLTAPFANKVQMENYEHSVSCKPSVNMRHMIECAKKQTPVSELYIRDGPVPSGADARLYDWGLFQIAASGQQVSGGAMGELWVSYKIQLLKPRIQSGIGGQNESNVNFDHIQVYNASKTTTGVLPATPFGTGTGSSALLIPTTESTLGGIATGGQQTAAGNFGYYASPTLNNFLGGVPVLAGGLPTGALGAGVPNTYYFPPGVSTGNYMISYNSLYGVGGANWSPTIAYVNCKALNLVDADTLPGQANVSSVTSVGAQAVFFVTVTAANASFSFPGSTGAYSTPTWAELFVTQIPSSIN